MVPEAHVRLGELVFSHKPQSHVDDQVVVRWSPNAARDWPSKGCYEVAATYTGQDDYVYCLSGIPGGCQLGLGANLQFHTFKMLDYTEIPSNKWGDYRNAPPTATPEADTETHGYTHARSNPHPAANSYPDSHARSYPYPYPITDSDSHACPNPLPYTHGHTRAHGHTDTSAPRFCRGFAGGHAGND